MNSIARDLAKQLRPGYRVEAKNGHEYYALDPNGRQVRGENGQVILFGGGNGADSLRASRRQLQLARAIPMPRPEKRSQPLVKVRPTASPNFIITAKETLRDPQSSPRERALAKECLRLLDVNLKLRSLATQLARHNRELDPTSA